MDAREIAKTETDLSRLMERQLGVKGRTLETQVRSAGRMLPKWARLAARRIIDATKCAGHPKLGAQINGAAVKKDAEALRHYLNAQDPKDRRKGRILGLLGVVVFNLLVVFAALIAVLRWRGLL